MFNRYLDLCVEDIPIFFGAQVERRPVACPACGQKGTDVFNKYGFNYQSCLNCKTLYVSPRPDEYSFVSYYQDALSTRFWADTFYKKTEDSRRAMVHKPKAQMIYSTLKEKKASMQLIDIGGGYGVFSEEFYKLSDVNTHYY